MSCVVLREQSSSFSLGRVAVIAAAVLILSGCRHTARRPDDVSCQASAMPESSARTLPPDASRVAFYPSALETGPWRPPGIAGPWPTDEYLRDGGDYSSPARVLPDWSVTGLEPEDTIAHYDTLDGETVVAPSNRVHLYAPRFGAVRRVDAAISHEVHQRMSEYESPLPAAVADDLQIVTHSVQPMQPVGEIGTRAASAFRERQQGGGLHSRRSAQSLQDRFLPHEDFLLIRSGILEASEKPRLAVHVEAAHSWSSPQAVQVTIEGVPASQMVSDEQPEAVYRFEHRSHPQLRIVKVASTDAARPGETVDFTLRFDNIGNEPVGNVTVIDNLSTRLEYLPESQSCSLKATFVEGDNQAQSLAVRWEIQQPLQPGQGGIIRFRCLVR